MSPGFHGHATQSFGVMDINKKMEFHVLCFFAAVKKRRNIDARMIMMMMMDVSFTHVISCFPLNMTC